MCHLFFSGAIYYESRCRVVFATQQPEGSASDDRSLAINMNKGEIAIAIAMDRPALYEPTEFGLLQ
jgi:hypothetical protein